MIIKHYEKAENKTYIFGVYNDSEWEDKLGYQGNCYNYLFTISPQTNIFDSNVDSGQQNYSYLNSRDISNSKFKKGIGFGGNDFNQFRLWIDDDIEQFSLCSTEGQTYVQGTLTDYHIKKYFILYILD